MKKINSNKILPKKIAAFFIMLVLALKAAFSVATITGLETVTDDTPATYVLTGWNTGFPTNPQLYSTNWNVDGGSINSGGGSNSTSINISWNVNDPPLTVQCQYQVGFFDPVSMDYIIVQYTVSKTINVIHTYQYTPAAVPGSYSISPTTSINYVHTITPLIPYGENAISFSGSRNPVNINEQIQYFDGLGRIIQSTDVKATSDGKDLVVPVEYDAYGRQDRDYLPFRNPSTTGYSPGEYEDNYHYILNDLYDGGSGFPDAGGYYYSEKVYDYSPLNRVTSQSAPGSSWSPVSGNTVDYTYGANTNDIKLWEMSGSTATNSGYYSANQLYVTTTTDENGVESKEYTDKLGRVVCKEAGSSASQRTYYIYDDFNRLRYVFSPKLVNIPGFASATPSNSNVEELGYYYEYDERGRMVIKQLPGAGQTHMVYDQRDRLVATQNEEERSDNVWYVYKYDALNRPIMEGTYSIIKSREDLITEVNGYSAKYESLNASSISYTAPLVHGYSNNSFPSNIVPLKIFYYDGYYFGGNFNYDANDIVSAGDRSLLVGGLPTATITKIHNSPTSKNQLLVVSYYDKYGRVIQAISDNHLSGYDIVSTQYENSVNSNTKAVKHEHSVTDATVDHTILYEYEYDHTGKPLRSYMTIDSDDRVLLSAQKYNVIGQVDQKYLHGDATTNVAIQQIDYSYNIRGWLTKINNADLTQPGDKFGMELAYDGSLASLGSSSEYNGNISAMVWNTSVSGGGKEAYGFNYDALNRLTSANYAHGSNPSYSAVYNEFGVNNITYDENGNIQSLTRRSDGTDIDALSYEYLGNDNSNRLKKVDDGESDDGFKDEPEDIDYTYDGNGNMVSDENKAISSIVYNTHLNLPTSIIRTGGNIAYTYDANGTKLRNNTPTGDNLDYISNFVYRNNILEDILTPEGKVVYESGNFSYQYFLKDHLGNTRVVMDENSNVLQANNYYPLGMHRPIQGDATQNYLYNGKEKQEGTDWYDYGVRFYDPSIGRFHTIDPMAEEPHNLPLSPYHYCNGNPILYIDVNGEDWFVDNETGEIHYFKGQDEITQEYADKMGYGGDISTLERLGADNMFGDKVAFGSLENILEGDYFTVGGYLADKFMGQQGFEKAVRQEILEEEIEDVSAEVTGFISQESSRKQVKSEAITYAKPEKMGVQGTPIEEIYKGGFPLRTTIKTKSYTEIRTYKERHVNELNVNKKAGIKSTNTVLGIISNIIEITRKL